MAENIGFRVRMILRDDGSPERTFVIENSDDWAYFRLNPSGSSKPQSGWPHMCPAHPITSLPITRTCRLARVTMGAVWKRVASGASPTTIHLVHTALTDRACSGMLKKRPISLITASGRRSAFRIFNERQAFFAPDRLCGVYYSKSCFVWREARSKSDA